MDNDIEDWMNLFSCDTTMHPQIALKAKLVDKETDGSNVCPAPGKENTIVRNSRSASQHGNNVQPDVQVSDWT